MKILGILTAFAIVVLGQTKDRSLESCLEHAGVPGQVHNLQQWSGGIMLTVSPTRDASRISFDKSAMEHVTYLAMEVLPELTFKKECVGSVIRFKLLWRPEGPFVHKMVARKDELIVSSYDYYSRTGDRILLFMEQVESLKTEPSLRQFLMRNFLGFRNRWPSP